MSSVMRSMGLRSAMPGSSTVNSSPPWRATVSDSRTQPTMRRAASTSRRSPASWPRVSFTSLKRSRSMYITATLSWERWAFFISSAEPVVEQAAVGQAGEGVVVGLHPHQGFGLLAFGDVGDDAHQPPYAAVARNQVALLKMTSRRMPSVASTEAS
jgi:hypothetical protein